jgi:membrane protease YdiL (CAAX protease family)
MSTNSEWPGATPETLAPPPDSIQPILTDNQTENPPWSGWDVTRIGLLMFVVPYVFIPITALILKQVLYRSTPWIEVAQKPWVALSTQFVWYGVMAVYMIMFVEGTFRRTFWEAIRWNWPRRTWPTLVPIGVVLVSLQYLERFFQLPKHIPMEEFLKTPLAAVLTGILAVSFGPLMEELYFRGFLYPVLARRFGVVMGVVSTAIAFGLIHAAQLAFAWGLVLIIFLVGVVLTIVRARLRSVGASFVVHVAYNSTLVLMGAWASQHGDKLGR